MAGVFCVLRYLVHTADVGHPFRPVPQHQEWARRVNEEFLAQGDREKELGFTPIEPAMQKNPAGLSNYPYPKWGIWGRVGGGGRGLANTWVNMSRPHTTQSRPHS